MSENPLDEEHGPDAVVEPGTEVIDSGDAATAGTVASPEPSARPSKRVASAISGKRYRKRDLMRLDQLRPSLAEFIRRDFPDLPDDAMVSLRELARYRLRYTEDLLQQEHGEFSELDRQVAESIARQDTIAENTEEEFEEHRTFGDVVADHLAAFGGSWWFLLSFLAVLVIWMAANIIAGMHAFDPYPFILLNLCLSTIAAVQAPIIMMSQKRQETKDRLRADNDYRVNLKAELEIRHLHEKLDYLISRQWQRLAEIQQLQMEMMHEATDAQRRSRVTTVRKPAAKRRAPKPTDQAGT
jgi:uncharacterized membrane protein